MTTVYKILSQAEWDAAVTAGVFVGSAIDLEDGYIHLSAADQAQKTADLYFRDRDDLLLLVIDAAALGEALKWEPSRGGALFPHLYGPLRPEQVSETRSISLGAGGLPQLGELVP